MWSVSLNLYTEHFSGCSAEVLSYWISENMLLSPTTSTFPYVFFCSRWKLQHTLRSPSIVHRRDRKDVSALIYFMDVGCSAYPKKFQSTLSWWTYRKYWWVQEYLFWINLLFFSPDLLKPSFFCDCILSVSLSLMSSLICSNSIN